MSRTPHVRASRAPWPPAHITHMHNQRKEKEQRAQTNDPNQEARCDGLRFDSKRWICINVRKEEEKEKMTSDVDMTDLEGEEEMEGKGFGEKSLLLPPNLSYLIEVNTD